MTTTDEPTSTDAGLPADPTTYLGLPASLTEQVRARLTAQVVSSGESPSVTMYAPFSGAPLAELPQCTPDEVLAAAERARAAQQQWAKVPVKERAKVFLRLHDLVLDAREQIMDVIQAENGKSRRDAFLEVADIAITCRYYARSAPKLLGGTRRSGMVPGLTAVKELHHPKGLVSVISPWNYPFSLAVGDTIPALLAGNAVVQKADNQTALTALMGLELARQAGVPEDLWQIVLGRGSAIGPAMLDIADFMMFTGSTESGRHIAAESGRRLIDCSLELGGKNALVVLEDADLDRAAEGAVRACFSSSGQLCISVERMYVAEQVHDAFMEKFLGRLADLQLGASYDFDKEMGSLTSQDQVEVTERHVADAVAHGATVLSGGRARPDLGPYFFEPTVLSGVEAGAECYREETFGPVVSVYTFRTDEEAVELANDSRYGLNASVWSRSASRGRRVGGQVRAGTVNVNEAFAAAWGSIDAPMGGMGDSGMGRRHGDHGLLKYTEPQTVAYQRLMNLAPPFASLGDKGFAEMLTKSLRLLKAFGWR